MNSNASVSEPDDFTTQAAPAIQKKVPRKAVVGTVVGNWLEFFDFVVYSIFAVTIGKEFFPADDPNIQILLSLATFGVGFLARPLGSVMIGAYADRAGRKAALTMTISFMAVGTAVMALTPSYAQIGLAAPVLLVGARLLQGFSAGGEMGAATSFLIESAPHGKRGLMGSWQLASQGLAIATGAAIGAVLTVSLSPEAMQSWGWRVPFVLGMLIAPVGMYIRRHMDETIEVGEHVSMGGVLASLFRGHGKLMIFSMLTVSGATITTYVLNTYMVTYAIQSLQMPMATAVLAALIAGVVTFFGSLLGGALSDRFGRRALVIWPRLLLLALIYPALAYVVEQKTLTALLLVVGTLSTLQAISAAPGLVLLPECFPRKVRAAALSISYAAATTVFGSTAAVFSSWLVTATGNPLSLAWFLIIANLVGLIALLPMKPPRAHEALD
ncbi:MFS transporter [Pseudodonghicola flavimaris]|uniref:MFS transporter n=1 Tax=Pseudodonghicola flavimaris TaxID=3050036 RepID=A0ABT7F7L2_9RHOB|nr:MFS transporter [Pseudodonghicola flavimaris]MDK3020480.1 MFS transporter [Pseudodonghicola flavimaris]